MKRGATMADIRRHAGTLLYLGSADKIMAALANEYGTERSLPSRRSIQEMLDARKAYFAKQRRDLIGEAI
jgi:hypothetical protein